MRSMMRALMAWSGAVALMTASSVQAESVQFSVRADKNRMGQDESLALRFDVKAEGAGWSLEGPRFSAPDFDEVHQFSNVFVESFYENGRFGARQTRQFTQVLRPKRQGTLRIDGLEVTVGGKVYRSDPITVQVEAGGAGTPPPSNYGGAGGGLRGAGKRGTSTPFFARVEVDQQRIYKGQQVVVSYYLYRRNRVMNIQVDKYPTLNGFLREELEMPIQSGRLDTESVVLDGNAYDRSLLVRYAAYPLKEGKLTLDPLGLRGNYFAPGGMLDEEDDPFQSFFRQMSPRVHTSRSEPLTIEVLPLPAEGRPSDFSGAVGNFSVTGAVDKAEVRAGEPLTYTVKVEGRGNLAAVAEPKVAWPDSVDLFESKGKTSGGRGGIGAKVFEFLLIPREEGTLSLPSVAFSFFDPEAKAYVVRKTDAFSVRVLAGDPNAVRPARPKPAASPSASAQSNDPAAVEDDRSWVPNELREGWNRRVRNRRIGMIAAIAIGALFLALAAWWVWKRGRRRKAQDRNGAEWERVRQQRRRQVDTLVARGDGLDDAGISQVYDLLSSAIYDAIDRRYDVGARAFSRSDLERLLLEEKRMDPELWRRCAGVLEHAEQVRFAGGGAGRQAARERLAAWVTEVRFVEEELARL